MGEVSKFKEPESVRVCLAHALRKDLPRRGPCTEGSCKSLSDRMLLESALGAIAALANDLYEAVIDSPEANGVGTTCESVIGSALAISGLASRALSETDWDLFEGREDAKSGRLVTGSD